MRNKITKIVLWFTLVTVGICMPTIVALEIIRNGNWWVMWYLVWVFAIEMVILMLLSQGEVLEGKRRKDIG